MPSGAEHEGQGRHGGCLAEVVDGPRTREDGVLEYGTGIKSGGDSPPCRDSQASLWQIRVVIRCCTPLQCRMTCAFPSPSTRLSCPPEMSDRWARDVACTRPACSSSPQPPGGTTEDSSMSSATPRQSTTECHHRRMLQTSSLHSSERRRSNTSPVNSWWNQPERTHELHRIPPFPVAQSNCVLLWGHGTTGSMAMGTAGVKPHISNWRLLVEGNRFVEPRCQLSVLCLEGGHSCLQAERMRVSVRH